MKKMGGLGRLKYLVIALAALLVFSTTYSLILPAITLEKTEAETMPGVSLFEESSGEPTEEDGQEISAGKSTTIEKTEKQSDETADEYACDSSEASAAPASQEQTEPEEEEAAAFDQAPAEQEPDFAVSSLEDDAEAVESEEPEVSDETGFEDVINGKPSQTDGDEYAAGPEEENGSIEEDEPSGDTDDSFREDTQESSDDPEEESEEETAAEDEDAMPAMQFEAELRKEGSEKTVAALTEEELEQQEAEFLEDEEAAEKKLAKHLKKIVLKVKVNAEEGTFPDGTTMKVKEVGGEQAVFDAAAGAVEGDVSKLQAVDISFFDKDGNEIKPEKEIRVTLISDTIRTEKQDNAIEPVIVHIPEDGDAEIVNPIDKEKLADEELPKDEEVVFENDRFSVYAVVYTVDFHWEANGQTFDFSIPGGGFVNFAELVEVLGIADPVANEEYSEEGAPVTLGTVEVSEDTRRFVNEVDSISFSTPELLSVSKAEENTTVGAIKDALKLECAYSAELTEEQIAEIDQTEVQAGDWALISLKAFESDEYLTVTMKNGDQIEIRMTDAQLISYVLTAGGETYKITLTYDETAEIPIDAVLEAEEIPEGTEEYNAYLTETLNALGIEGESKLKNVAFARFFDIRILADGKEMEPKSPVNVEISYLNGCKVPQGLLEVVHFAETGTEVIPAATVYEEEETLISFSQNSFSATGTVVTRDPMDFDGEYMIVYQAGDGKYYAYTNDNSKVEVNFNPSKMTVSYPGDGNPVWNVADCYNYQYFYHDPAWLDHFAIWGQVNNQYITLPAYSNNILANGWNSVIFESAGNGKYTMKNGSGNRYLGWSNNNFASVSNASQAIPFYMVKVEPIDEIDTTEPKVDERVHYIITDHYITESGSLESGDIVRTDGYLESGQSISFASNPVSGQEYAGVTVTAGHDAVTIGSNGAVTVSHNSDIHLVHVDYYYKSIRSSVQAALFDENDKYDTKIIGGQKQYELSEERVHTDKTASVVEGGDGRSFNLTLEAWNVDWNIASVGMVLDASGSMAWDGAPGHYMQVNSDGKYQPYTFLSQEEVNKILYTDYSDYSVSGYGDYTYFVYEDGKSVNEYAPLGYYAGANHSGNYLTIDGTSSTRYATQQNIPQGIKGWYYVNTASANPFNAIGGAKEYNGIQTNRNKSGSTPYSNKDFYIPIGGNQTKHINFYQPDSYDNDFKAWLSNSSEGGKYRTESDYNAGTGTPSQFYVDQDGYLCCFYYHSNEVFQSYVYAKQDIEPIKTEMLQDAIGSFVSIMDSVAPDSAFGMTRFSRSNTTNSNGFNDNQLPLLNWTIDSESIIGSLNMAYGGEYKANSSQSDPGYENAGSLTVYDYGLTSNTSTQSGLTSFNTYLASNNAALNRWAQDKAKPVNGGYEYDKYVIVFTDGKDTDLTSAAHRDRAKNAADDLKSKGFSVITVLLAPDSAFNHDTGALNQEFTDAKNFLDTLNGPCNGGTGLDWTDETFIATAADKNALKTIFQDIANHISKSLTEMTVRDYIDPRFRLVDENDEPISVGPHPELGFTLYYDAARDMQYVEWTGQTIPTNNVMDNTVVDEDGEAADISLWSQTIRVRAKDDFLGGNDVLSNANVEELNKVYPDGEPGNTDPKTSRTFPRTTVDPQLLTLELGSTEDTVFLGETIDADEHDKLESAIGATVESSWYYEYLERYGTVTATDYITQIQQGTEVRIPYYYIPENTTRAEFNSAQLDPNNNDAYMKDQIGWLTYEWVPCDANGNEITITDPYDHLITNTDDIHYRLKIKYEPFTESERDDYVDDMIDADDHDRPVKDPVGTPQTVLESAKDEGIATVHVVSGQLTVSKQVKKEDILKYLAKHEQAVFTFKLTKTGTPSAQYPALGTDYTAGHGGYTYPVTISVTVTSALVNAAAVSPDGYVTITGTTVEKLPIGTYEVEENPPADSSFEFDSIGHLAVDANYRASVADASAKVTFEIGELAADASVTTYVQEDKPYLNAQKVSVYARNNVNVSVPVSLKKVDIGNTNVLLGNAVFSLYGEDAVDGTGKLKPAAVPILTGITTNAAADLGFADLGELDIGTYYLVETAAPAGYNLPDYEYIKITVGAGEVGYQTGTTGEPKTAVLTERNEQEVYLIEVYNSAGYELPSAGGIGTTLFYVLGAVFVLGAGVLLVSRRVKPEE